MIALGLGTLEWEHRSYHGNRELPHRSWLIEKFYCRIEAGQVEEMLKGDGEVKSRETKG